MEDGLGEMSVAVMVVIVLGQRASKVEGRMGTERMEAVVGDDGMGRSVDKVERGECMERRGAVVVDDDFSPREGVPLGSGKGRPVTTAGSGKRSVGRV